MCRYGAVPAVDALSFALGAGRCLGVIGESGAGKTQAFLALMGLSAAGARGQRHARDSRGVPLLAGAGRRAARPRGRDDFPGSADAR